jgi:hypothetical protein
MVWSVLTSLPLEPDFTVEYALAERTKDSIIAVAMARQINCRRIFFFFIGNTPFNVDEHIIGITWCFSHATATEKTVCLSNNLQGILLLGYTFLLSCGKIQ